MKITRVEIERSSAQPPLDLGNIYPGINVFTAGASLGAASVADFLGQTLYGVTAGSAVAASDRWTPCEGQVTVQATGLAAGHSEGPTNGQAIGGTYELRRRLDHGRTKLTIVGLHNSQVDSHTIERLVAGMSPQLLGRIFYSDAAGDDRLPALLSDEVAREYRRATGMDSPTSTTFHNTRQTTQTSSVDTQSLVAQRERLAEEIETLLANRRQTSVELQQRLAEYEREIATLRQDRQQAATQLQAAETELAEIETRARYHAIALSAERASEHREPADWQPRLDELEVEIERWRHTLSDLERRESAVRSELSRVHPDESSPAAPLADQRAAVAVARRLTQDIESEVARLARAIGSEVCVCHDAHPRLNPLVETLTKHLHRLAELNDQQERAYRVQELEIESVNLSRSQEDIRRQLDQLLKRRQELWRSGRPRVDEMHVSTSEDLSLATQQHRGELENRIAQLRSRLESVSERLADAERDFERISRERSDLLSDARLNELNADLQRLQSEINTARQQTAHETVSSERLPTRWRASELLARLTDGRLRSLRLTNGGRSVVATDLQGQEWEANQLAAGDRHLVAMSLTLAMVAGFDQCGIHLPLVLEEPFAPLDDQQTSILAGTLENFAHEGRQVLIFTDRGAAIDRFASLGVPITNLSTLWQRGTVATETIREPARETIVSPAPMPVRRTVTPVVTPTVAPLAPVTTASKVASATTSAVTSTSATAVKKTTVRRASEYLLDPEDSIERFPAAVANRGEVFARARIRTIGDLLSADPSALAEELNRDDVTAELVALWQTHLAFVCFMPEATFDDAVAFTGAGYFDIDELSDADADELHSRIDEYLRSEHGERLRSRGYSSSRSRSSEWVSRARRGRDRWRGNRQWDGWRRHRGERRNWVESQYRGNRRSRSNSSGSRSGRTSSSETSRLRLRTDSSDRSSSRRSTERRSSERQTERRSERTKREPRPERTSKPKRRFYLEVSSPVVDAPSIGPKTAKKINKLGIHTVSDLLNCDPETIAAGLDMRGVDAEKVVAWQHQAQLVCRIPQLRGHDAQIMVASGFTTPEEVAQMKPSELLEFIEPFCSSSEGARVLRNSSPPDLDEVTNWIAWSRDSRTLGAA